MSTNFSDRILPRDTHANLPTATEVPEGSLYPCSDHDIVYRATAGSWVDWLILGGSGVTPSAYPQIEASASTSQTSDSTNHVVNLPTLSAGQTLLIISAIDGTATVSASGWTALTSFANANAGNVSITALWKIASGSEGATVALTVSASERGEHYAMAISGAHASAPIEGASVNGAATTAHDPPSLTPSWGSDDNLWIACAAADASADSAQTYLRIPILSCHEHVASPGNVAGVALGIATREFTGTVWDPQSFAPQTSEQFCAGTIAIRPA